MSATWEVSREKRRRTGKYDAAAVFIVVMVVVVVDIFVVVFVVAVIIFVVTAARICNIGVSRDLHVKNLSIDHSRVDVRNHVIEP